jgi:4-amino-4-deoxy-L-arabinose transferase-like glycosyltransferase
MSRGRSLGLLVLFMLLSLVRGMFYAALVPPWQAPDEPRHFEYIRLLYEKRRSVGWSDIDPSLEEEIIQSMDRYDYWRFGRFHEMGRSFQELWGGASHKLEQPPLSYLLYVPLLLLIPPEETSLQLYSFRLVSVFLGALVVLLAFLTARELFPDDEVMQVGVPAFVTFLPMHTFVISSVNSDHLAEVFVSLSLFLLVRVFRRGLSLYDLVGIWITVLLAALAKRTALFMIPTLLAAVPLYMVGRGRQMSWGKALFISLGLVTALVGLGVAFIGRLESMLVEISPKLAGMIHHARVYYLFLPSQQFPLAWEKGYLGPEALAIYREWMGTLFQSFWGNFGWLNLPLGAGWYQLLGLACVISFVGFFWLVIRESSRGWLTQWQRGVLLVFSLATIFATGLIVAKHVRSLGFEWAGVPQGRWLFAVIVPIATLLLLGWRALVPERGQRWLLRGWVASFVILDSVALVHYIVPFFYG